MNDATAYRLHERLFQIGACETPPGDAGAMTAQEARECIEHYQCNWAVCDRVPKVGGKPKTFEQFFALVFNETLDGKAVKGAA
jgi:hypothetical protein